MSKARVLGLYRELLRTGSRFSDYNIRECDHSGQPDPLVAAQRVTVGSQIERLSSSSARPCRFAKRRVKEEFRSKARLTVRHALLLIHGAWQGGF